MLYPTQNHTVTAVDIISEMKDLNTRQTIDGVCLDDVKEKVYTRDIFRRD